MKNLLIKSYGVDSMLKTITIAAVLALASTSGFANENARTDSLFTDLDVDMSGSISKEEATNLPGLVSQWQDLDTNGDNQLDREEFTKIVLK